MPAAATSAADGNGGDLEAGEEEEGDVIDAAEAAMGFEAETGQQDDGIEVPLTAAGADDVLEEFLSKMDHEEDNALLVPPAPLEGSASMVARASDRSRAAAVAGTAAGPPQHAGMLTQPIQVRAAPPQPSSSQAAGTLAAVDEGITLAQQQRAASRAASGGGTAGAVPSGAGAVQGQGSASTLVQHIGRLQQVLETSFAQAMALTSGCREAATAVQAEALRLNPHQPLSQLQTQGAAAALSPSEPPVASASADAAAGGAAATAVRIVKVEDEAGDAAEDNLCKKGYQATLSTFDNNPRLCGEWSPASSSATSADEVAKLTPMVPGFGTGSGSRSLATNQDTAVSFRHYEILPQWRGLTSTPVQPPKLRRRYLTIFTREMLEESQHNSMAVSCSGTAGMMEQHEGWSLRSLMIPPSSIKRGTWDSMSIFLVGWDSFVIPLQLFEPPPNVFFSLMMWVTRLFWTLDIPVSFFTGCAELNGTVTMSPSVIARKYLRTWFCFDLLVVGLDWIELLLSEGVVSMSWTRVSKATRFFRIARMLRLLRLARVQDTASNQLSMFLDNLQSERLTIIIDIVKVTVMLTGISHIFACIWYGIGANPPDIDVSWVVIDGFQEASFLFRYTTSLHWALTQFQGGMDEVRPHNIMERIYTILTLLFGFILATAVIGRLTSAMTQLSILSSHNSRKISALKTYLKQKSISRRLAFRIHRNALHSISLHEHVVQEESVELLHFVSEPLRAELHFELYSPCFGDHSFFSSLISDYPEIMSKVCHQAVAVTEVSVGDAIFHAGEKPDKPKMYILTEGELKYVTMQGGMTKLFAGHFISEAVLWTTWTHVGLLVASTEARMSVIDSVTFVQIVQSFSLTVFSPESDPRRYAAHFVEELNKAREDEDLDDLFTIATELGGASPIGLESQMWVTTGRASRASRASRQSHGHAEHFGRASRLIGAARRRLTGSLSWVRRSLVRKSEGQAHCHPREKESPTAGQAVPPSAAGTAAPTLVQVVPAPAVAAQ